MRPGTCQNMNLEWLPMATLCETYLAMVDFPASFAGGHLPQTDPPDDLTGDLDLQQHSQHKTV